MRRLLPGRQAGGCGIVVGIVAGVLYGVGVGPGDPELLTLKAIKAISDCDVLCYIANDSGHSIALDIVKPSIPDLFQRTSQLMPVVLPMNTNRQYANTVYDETAEKIIELLASGLSITMICEGDPLYYGSFINVYQRLADRCQIEIIPGISSVHNAAARLKFPLCAQKDRLATVTARSSDADIIDALRTFETVVILKAGADRQRIKALIQKSASTVQAAYVENVGRDDEVLIADLEQLPVGPGGYFSMFLCKRNDF